MFIGIIYTCWCKYLYPMNIWPHLHNTSNILSNTMTAENAIAFIYMYGLGMSTATV